MIADAFSPVNILEQGAQMAKGEQSRMVRAPAPRRTRAMSQHQSGGASRRARVHAPLPRPPTHANNSPLSTAQSSICGALAVADLVKTSLGPKGMDKILQSSDRGGNVSVTNDGATILKSVLIDVRHRTAPQASAESVAPPHPPPPAHPHSTPAATGPPTHRLTCSPLLPPRVQNPAAKVLIEISKVQDDEVGDGTTSVCVLAGDFPCLVRVRVRVGFRVGTTSVCVLAGACPLPG